MQKMNCDREGLRERLLGMLDLMTTPYPLAEALGMIQRRFSPRPPRGDRAAFQQVKIDSGRTTDDWIGFVGDISPLRGRQVRYDPVIVDFFSDCRRVVGNLEGVITDRAWLPYLHNHTPEIFDALARLRPLDHWILSVANNHAMDYGLSALRRTMRECGRRAVGYFGTSDRPRISIGRGITVTSWSWWLNRAGEGIARTDPGNVPQEGLHVAYPHWGYEHEREPRRSQRNQLPDHYTAVVGHHSHLPQPLELCEGLRPVAWSLGNFITNKQLPVLGEGAVLKLGISYGSDTPELTEVRCQEVDIQRPLRQNICAVVPRRETGSAA